jgi:hypothetical protein
LEEGLETRFQLNEQGNYHHDLFVMNEKIDEATKFESTSSRSRMKDV